MTPTEAREILWREGEKLGTLLDRITEADAVCLAPYVKFAQDRRAEAQRRRRDNTADYAVLTGALGGGMVVLLPLGWICDAIGRDACRAFSMNLDVPLGLLGAVVGSFWNWRRVKRGGAKS